MLFFDSGAIFKARPETIDRWKFLEAASEEVTG